MKNKNIIVMSTLLMSILLLGVGTFAYFTQSVEGTLTGQTGNLVLVVNEVDAVLNESFNIRLKRSETEDFIMPDDSGSFNINIDSTGSISDVEVTVSLTRTNLPDNLKFYVDEEHTTEFTTNSYIIKNSNSMIKSVTVYWYWDGSIDDENDTLFMGKPIVANVNVSAIISESISLYETLASKESTLDTNVDFGTVASSSNGQGLMMLNTSQSSTYPILYYRGDVTDNNVIYGGYCWLIVRTTETGGTKLIYNGEVNADGSCNNYSGVGGVTANSDSIGVSLNRTTYSGGPLFGVPQIIGYMFNGDVEFFALDENDEIVGLDLGKYKEYLEDDSIDNETGRHTQNKNDSEIKGVIDSWYISNIYGKSYESLLEDTVWCNDRNIIEKIENFTPGTTIKYPPLERLNNSPSLMCSRKVDKFTVSRENGNGDLTYPIGMLTLDEMNMAGYYDNTIPSYLTTSGYYLTMSPGIIENLENPLGIIRGYSAYVFPKPSGATFVLNEESYLRPSISLGLNATVIDGNGSFSKPYIIG